MITVKKSILIFTNSHANAFLIQKAHQSQFSAFLKYAAANTVLTTMKVYNSLQKNGKKSVVVEVPKDTVIIHQFPRAFNTPSLSQFCLKLETWCRAANIKYQNKFGMTMSERGTLPFIQLNDQIVEDSRICIDYLSKVYQIDLNSGLTNEQKAIARAALALSEDSLKWSMALHRFWYSKNPKQELGLPFLSIWLYSYRIYRAGLQSGYARYTKQELYERGKQDLTALNNLIGNKKFLVSDSKPCNEDFAVFGITTQIKYNDRGPLNQHLLSECPNVNRHVETIKEMYWSDWDKNTYAGKKKTVTADQKSLLQRVKTLFKK